MPVNSIIVLEMQYWLPKCPQKPDVQQWAAELGAVSSPDSQWLILLHDLLQQHLVLQEDSFSHIKEFYIPSPSPLS